MVASLPSKADDFLRWDLCVVSVEKMSDNVLFFKQKTAYELRISDWSSDVCSSDLHAIAVETVARRALARKDPAGDEAAEVAEDVGRKAVGRLAPAGQPAAVVDIIGVEQILPGVEIIVIADRADRPFAVGGADAPVAVVGDRKSVV